MAVEAFWMALWLCEIMQNSAITLSQSYSSTCGIGGHQLIYHGQNRESSFDEPTLCLAAHSLLTPLCF